MNLCFLYPSVFLSWIVVLFLVGFLVAPQIKAARNLVDQLEKHQVVITRANIRLSFRISGLFLALYFFPGLSFILRISSREFTKHALEFYFVSVCMIVFRGILNAILIVDRFNPSKTRYLCEIMNFNLTFGKVHFEGT